MNTRNLPPFSHSANPAPGDLFAGEQNTLQHAHSIARTIPFCLTQEEKQRRVNRLLGYAVESFK